MPNNDRIAREGVAFTDYYAQQSCRDVVGRFLMTLVQYPPSGTPATNNRRKVQQQIEEMSKARAK